MSEDDQKQIADAFARSVNMTAGELETWLDTDESTSVGRRGHALALLTDDLGSRPAEVISGDAPLPGQGAGRRHATLVDSRGRSSGRRCTRCTGRSRPSVRRPTIVSIARRPTCCFGGRRAVIAGSALSATSSS